MPETEGEGDADQQGTLGNFSMSEVQGRNLSQSGRRRVDLQGLFLGLPDQGGYSCHAY